MDLNNLIRQSKQIREFKRLSRQLYTLAARSGKIKIPKECSKCGEVTKTKAHHEDYRFPLKVRHLCDPCHKSIHRALKTKTKPNYYNFDILERFEWVLVTDSSISRICALACNLGRATGRKLLCANLGGEGILVIRIK